VVQRTRHNHHVALAPRAFVLHSTARQRVLSRVLLVITVHHSLQQVQCKSYALLLITVSLRRQSEQVIYVLQASSAPAVLIIQCNILALLVHHHSQVQAHVHLLSLLCGLILLRRLIHLVTTHIVQHVLLVRVSSHPRHVLSPVGTYLALLLLFQLIPYQQHHVMV